MLTSHQSVTEYCVLGFTGKDGWMDGETSLQIVDSTSLSSAGGAEKHFKTKNPDI